MISAKSAAQTTSVSPSELPTHSVASDTNASNTAAAAAASKHNNNGFDLINHAIRIVPPAPPPSQDFRHYRTSELLLTARLLERQRELSAHHAHNHRRHTSSAIATLLQQQQAQHHQLTHPQQSDVAWRQPPPVPPPPPPTTTTTPPEPTAAATAGFLPTTTSSTLPASAEAIIRIDQNARQLNPNAFQFPWKLHDMLDRARSEGNEEVVSWVDDGEAFRVHLPDTFVSNVMPRFFKQTKYKSFQRQLNLYGFTRLHNGPNKGGYKHKYFRQGQRTLCQLITRCPLRDSSSAATSAAAKEDTTTATSIQTPAPEVTVVDDEDETTTATTAAHVPHYGPQHEAQMLSHHQRQMLALMSRQGHEKEQLHWLQQQYEAHRIHNQQMSSNSHHPHPSMHHRARSPVGGTVVSVPTLPLEGKDHSIGRKVSLPGCSSGGDTSSTNASLESREEPQEDVATAAAAPKTTAPSFPKEFQFPSKLYDMLQRADERNFSSVVSWMPGDACFKVHDVERFVNDVMPSFFKQSKYKSFQRQLNLYGFSRVDSGPNKGGYRHSNFLKGRRDLLSSILRMKIKGNGRPRSSSDRPENNNNNAGSEIVSLDNSNHTSVVLSSSRHNFSLAETNKATAAALPPDSPASAKSRSPVPATPETSSGIDIILEAIQKRERSDSEKSSDDAAAPETKRPHVVHDSDTIPSTIDVRMKDATATTKDTEDAAKNVAYGLSWRQDPSESFSDWTIEVVCTEEGRRNLYHVHRRVLAVGPKKSDYFANIFKSNGNANRNKLHLNKQQAAVFPMVLDYIYNESVLDWDSEKAYTLYGLGEKLQNASIVRTVTEFYYRNCMTKDNVTEFIRLGQSFKDESLYNAAVVKCSQSIWSMDTKTSAKMDPDVLRQVLSLAGEKDHSYKYNSNRVSQLIASCVANATFVTLTPDIFKSLTAKALLPSVDPLAAIKLLATENTLLTGVEVPPPPGDACLHKRCVDAIVRNWSTLQRSLAGNRELANTMRSISSIVLFDILMKTAATSTESKATSTQCVK